MGRGLIGIFIGEMFGAQEGLGYLISLSAQTFDIPGMFVGVLVLATAGVLCTAMFQNIERPDCSVAAFRSEGLRSGARCN